MDRRTKAEKAIEKYVYSKMPKAVKAQVEGALHDLFHGPISKEDARANGIRGWKGYSHAIDIIGGWFDDKIPSELWYDNQSDQVLEDEPEAWEDEDTGEMVEPFWEDYYKFESRDIKRAVFGSELGPAI